MKELEDFGKICRCELTENVLPFWLEHGWDRTHGGVYTCLNRDGSLMDPTKSVWFQGRFAYVLSYAANHVLFENSAGRDGVPSPSAFGRDGVPPPSAAVGGRRWNGDPTQCRIEWLEAAKSAIDFFEAHCFDARGRMYFEVAADGTPLRMRRYLFSEAFAAIAHAEYAKALVGADLRAVRNGTVGADLRAARNGTVGADLRAARNGTVGADLRAARAHADRALDLFRRIRAAQNDPALCPPKYEPAMTTQGHSLTMILINVANVLKQVSDDPILDAQIDESIDRLFRYFVKPEFKCILETVGPKGEFIDTCAGRTINPGHGIETSWFLMDVAKQRDDKALLAKALQILDWQWNWGWDRENEELRMKNEELRARERNEELRMKNEECGGGGIISFRDCRGLPPQCYEQDMKFWWPQCEAIIANLEAYTLTGDAKWLDRFRLVRDWAWRHLKDPDYPEWFGYLHRDGTVAQPAKGNLFKGPFHIPRMLVKCAELCQESV